MLSSKAYLFPKHTFLPCQFCHYLFLSWFVCDGVSRTSNCRKSFRFFVSGLSGILFNIVYVSYRGESSFVSYFFSLSKRLLCFSMCHINEFFLFVTASIVACLLSKLFKTSPSEMYPSTLFLSFTCSITFLRPAVLFLLLLQLSKLLIYRKQYSKYTTSKGYLICLAI